MELTAQELATIANGDLVRFVLPNTQIECVVVRGDLLDSLRVRTDYSPCDFDDLARLTSETLVDEDWTMPQDASVRQPS